jgi:two-component system nitrate/nitrite response regulator NarL
MPMPALPPVTLLVVDDHNLFRRGLVALLGQDPGLKVVGEAGDAAQAMRLAPALRPDVILLDNHLPGVTGVDAIRGLREVSPSSRVLMLTVSEDAQDLSMALRNGAQGYLLKTIDGDLLAQAIRRAAAGEPVVSPELMGKLVAAFQSQGRRRWTPWSRLRQARCIRRPPIRQISARRCRRAKKKCCARLPGAASNKEIARALDIAETTVKIHVQHILRKLGLSSRVQAAVYASDRQR